LRPTPVTWLYWSFRSCLQSSTLLTMQFCSDDFKHLGSKELLYTGLSRTCSANSSMFILQLCLHLPPSSSAVYHRALFLTLSSFCYKLPLYSCRWKTVVFILITSQITLRSTGSAFQRHPSAQNYRAIFLSISMLLQLDAITHAPAQYCQDGNHLANHWFAFALVATTTSSSLLPLRICSVLITPFLVVHDLGIHIYADVFMRSQVMKTMSAGFAVLRQLRTIRCSVPRTVCQSLVSCLVLLRLDYCNTKLAGIPLHLAWHLQSVMNVATRLLQKIKACNFLASQSNSTQYCSTGTVFFSMFPFLQTNITSQMWPSGGKGRLPTTAVVGGQGN